MCCGRFWFKELLTRAYGCGTLINLNKIEVLNYFSVLFCSLLTKNILIKSL